MSNSDKKNRKHYENYKQKAASFITTLRYVKD